MFTAALFTIAKLWKQPKCPSVDEWVQRLGYMYILNHYRAIKKREILPFATTWVDLESIMLRNKPVKIDKYHVISLICGI